MSDLFRAGDVVDHGPSGERWQLAIDQIGPNVFPCGTPIVRAQACDCSIHAKASDEERMIMLRAIAASDRRDIDMRSEHARFLIASETPAEKSAGDLEAFRALVLGAVRELVGMINDGRKPGRKQRAEEIARSIGLKL